MGREKLTAIGATAAAYIPSHIFSSWTFRRTDFPATFEFSLDSLLQCLNIFGNAGSSGKENISNLRSKRRWAGEAENPTGEGSGSGGGADEDRRWAKERKGMTGMRMEWMGPGYELNLLLSVRFLPSFRTVCTLLLIGVVSVLVCVPCLYFGDIGETNPKVPRRHALYVPSTRKKFSTQYLTKMSGMFISPLPLLNFISKLIAMPGQPNSALYVIMRSDWLRDALLDLPPSSSRITLSAIPPRAHGRGHDGDGGNDSPEREMNADVTTSTIRTGRRIDEIGQFSIQAEGDFGSVELDYPNDKEVMQRFICVDEGISFRSVLDLLIAMCLLVSDEKGE